MRYVTEAAFLENHCWLLDSYKHGYTTKRNLIAFFLPPSGDQGYPRLPWLITPVRGTPEYFYNILHTRVRMVVGRCIGVLKARWWCICNDNALPYRPENLAGLSMPVWFCTTS
ncbi:hypothetical protein FOCC_FOCC015851 [Frankliniella occidentalis]|nr:hypothetical protein FOCC_FOCC015851 [Frankliniella occidentalis]